MKRVRIASSNGSRMAGKLQVTASWLIRAANSILHRLSWLAVHGGPILEPLEDNVACSLAIHVHVPGFPPFHADSVLAYTGESYVKVLRVIRLIGLGCPLRGRVGDVHFTCEIGMSAVEIRDIPCLALRSRQINYQTVPLKYDVMKSHMYMCKRIQKYCQQIK